MSVVTDSLGDRMKLYYEMRDRYYLTRRIPVLIRVDGRAFHTYTRGFNRPFDQDVIYTMVTAAKAVAEEMQGFKAAYIQSDEVSFLLTDYDTFATSAWFDYNKSKVETISASIMTAHFNRIMYGEMTKLHDNPSLSQIDRDKTLILREKIAYFDARSWNAPKEDVANYFLWRCQDWCRNSLSMYCRSFFSSNDMQHKARDEQHEMLHGIGKNWATDLSPRLKNGTFIVREEGTNGYKELTEIPPDWSQINELLRPLLEAKET